MYPNQVQEDKGSCKEVINSAFNDGKENFLMKIVLDLHVCSKLQFSTTVAKKTQSCFKN